MNLNYFRIYTTLVILTFPLLSEAMKYQSLGQYKSSTKKSDYLEITTLNRTLRIYTYAEGIIRVRVEGSDGFDPDHSYAVVAKPTAFNAKLTEQAEKLIIETSELKVEIVKNPIRINFYSSEGKLINADEPAFGVSWVGDKITCYKTLQPNERFFGLGEKTGGFERTGSGYTNWNTDRPNAVKEDEDPLYKTFPFYYGLHQNTAYGIFFDNVGKTEFNFGASNNRFASFSAYTGELDYYFMAGPLMENVLKKYVSLTGTMPLPPIWSLGFHQCRWSYYPDHEVVRIAESFRDHKLPIDNIVLDIDHMDKFKVFTWHKEYFPQPQKMLDRLTELDIKTTVIIDPGVKIEDGYPAYHSGLENDIFVKYTDGKAYSAQVWPGWTHFTDYTTEKGREWWGKNFDGYVKNGVMGFWNDMNEIASWGQQTPDNIVFNNEGNPKTHYEMRNVYGMQMAKATYEGTKKLLDGKRPFVLTRSAYSGVQRYSAVWTGDNGSSEASMLLGVRMVLGLGLAGTPFAGPDAGGFFDNASAELYTRWMGLGVFTPFYRAHKIKDSERAEPWSFGEKTLDATRNLLRLRYYLMPYIYSTFYQASSTGMPVARPMVLMHQSDAEALKAKYQHQYYFGDGLMVVPEISTVKHSDVYLPNGDWFQFFTDEPRKAGSFADGNSIYLPAVYVKGGSIIPMWKDVQSTSDNLGDTLFLHVYNGNQNNSFVYYEDDGNTYKNLEGQFYKQNIIFDHKAKTITFAQAEGSYKSKFKNILVIFHGFGKSVKISVDKKMVDAKPYHYSFLRESLEKIEYKPRPDIQQNPSALIQFNGKPMVIGIKQ